MRKSLWALLLVACGGDAASPAAPAAVATITLSQSTLSLKIGETQTLTASVSDAKGNSLANRAIAWSVADASIAQINNAGTVTALASGQTSVTATSEGKTATATLSVLSLPTITVTSNLPKVFVGDTAIITWTSTNAATCSRTGGWTGSASSSGQLAYVPSDGGVKTLSMSCTGAGGTALSSTTLTVPLPVLATSYENAKAYPPLQVPRIPKDTLSAQPCVADDAIAYADFFQDGSLSLFVNGSNPDTPGRMCFWRRTPQGTWQNATKELLQDSTGCILARKILIADFNRDKRPDLYLACSGQDYPPYPGERSILLMSTTAGKYTRIELPEVAYIHGGAAADLNGDGYPDLLFLDSNKKKYWVLLNDRGAGTFTRDDTRLPTAFLGNRPWYTAELLDLDKDGALDLFISGFGSDDPISSAPATIHWGDRNGRFNTRAPVILPRIDGCVMPFDVVLLGDKLYILRNCGDNVGAAVQRVSMSDLSSTLHWDARNGPGVWWWIFVLNGKLLLEKRQLFLLIEP